ncbi:Mitochondrial/chloroplast ribosomal protein L19 [Sesbania bispinosa]|nr:Mitochondrial/chloroplast ribosomal protein L19 [Sesbania bispinosa]
MATYNTDRPKYGPQLGVLPVKSITSIFMKSGSQNVGVNQDQPQEVEDESLEEGERHLILIMDPPLAIWQAVSY